MANDSGDQSSQESTTPRWLQILAKVAGVIAALAVFISGIVTCTSIFNPLCVGAGIIMLGIAFVLILFEAPICCMYFEKTKKLSAWLEGRKYWQKGLVYVILSIIPVAMCPIISSIIGCLFSFAVGVLYGFMSLRRGGSGNENARGSDFDGLQG